MDTVLSNPDGSIRSPMVFRAGYSLCGGIAGNYINLMAIQDRAQVALEGYPLFSLIVVPHLKEAPNSITASIVISPKGYDILTPFVEEEKLQSVLLHEGLHLILRHWRLGGEHLKTASDLSIAHMTDLDCSSLPDLPHRRCTEFYLSQLFSGSFPHFHMGIRSDSMENALTAACRAVKPPTLMEKRLSYCVNLCHRRIKTRDLDKMSSLPEEELISLFRNDEFRHRVLRRGLFNKLWKSLSFQKRQALILAAKWGVANHDPSI